MKIFKSFNIFIFSFFYLLLIHNTYAEPKTVDLSESLNKIVSAAKKQYSLKSVIFGVWIDNKKIITGALGDSMTGVPTTTNMHFRIGGVTETFLETLLMQLVEQKKISLDDKLSKWYPEMPDANLITVRMIANSQTGYPDYVYSKDFAAISDKEVFKHWTSDELLKYAFVPPLLYKPGTSANYSHTNYIILGKILQKVTGLTYDQLLQTHILSKLNLKNTHFTYTAEMQHPTLHAFSSARGIYEDATFWDPSWTSYSGLMTSTINDLGTWANAFGQGLLLSKHSYNTLFAPINVGLGNNKSDLYLAMGCAVMNHWIVQNPMFDGYSGIFAYLPSKKITIIIFNTLNPSNSSQKNYSMSIFRQLVEYLAPNDLIPQRAG